MEVLFDLDCDEPQLILRFEDIDDLVAFLAGFWERLN